MAYNIIIAQFKHETNTFNTDPCTVQCFRDNQLLFGEDIIPYFTGGESEVGAFIDYFSKVEDVKLIPSVAANATPRGRVTREIYTIVRDAVVKAVKGNRVDAILFSMHGAMVTDFDEDGEGSLLEELRAVTGEKIPIFVTLDLHANITEKMVKHASAMFPYDCYPHTDAYEKGLEAADNLYKTLKNEIRPVKRFRKLPILMPLLSDSDEPKKSIFKKVYEYEKMDKVISISVVDGFFPADIRECGMSILVQTDGDEKLADNLADEFAGDVMNIRHRLVKEASSVDDAIKTALVSDEGPVVLADFADNPGGGSNGDGTWVLQGLIKYNVKNAAIAHFYDPVAVAQAVKAGVGSTIRVKLGGSLPEILGEAVVCDAYVKSITDGVYFNRDKMFRGCKNNIGTTVVLVIGGIEVIVSERRHQAFDTQIFRANGIEPSDKKILVVKSSLHFRASYSLIAKKIIYVSAPGLMPTDPLMFKYKNIRRPIYPLDKI